MLLLMPSKQEISRAMNAVSTILFNQLMRKVLDSVSEFRVGIHEFRDGLSTRAGVVNNPDLPFICE